MMIVAAMMVPQGCWNALPDSPTNDVIASGTVYLSGSWMKDRANRYSFQAEMNASSPVVTRPGSDQRKENLVEDLERCRAVDVCGLLEISGAAPA